MVRRTAWGRRARSGRWHTGRAGSRGRSRGVSDIVGTILILALTVALFSSIFFFVDSFPKPAAQPSSQFAGQLTYIYVSSSVAKGACGKNDACTNISGVSITHLGGPSIYNFNTQIYLSSQAHPQNTTTIYNISNGFGNAAVSSWGIGQVWNVSLLNDHLSTPDNITITIVSDNLVVYRVILPGSNPTIPPTFLSVGTTPTTPSKSSTFTLYANIYDPFLLNTSKDVNVSVAASNGGIASCGATYMTYSATSGYWTVSCTAGSKNGTYYVSINATDKNGLSNAIYVPITVGGSSSSGGGGSSSSSCSVTYTATLASSPAKISASGAPFTLYLNLSALPSGTPSGNPCSYIYVSGNLSASYTATAGTGTSHTPSPSSYSNEVVYVNGATVELKPTWTSPTLTGCSARNPCTGTAVVSFVISYSSGATSSTGSSTIELSYTVDVT